MKMSIDVRPVSLRSALLLGGVLCSALPASAQEAIAETETANAEQQQIAQNEEQVAANTTDPSQDPQSNVLEQVTVVRARNRLEPLQDVPLSISVVTGGELEQLKAEDLGAITRRAANVSWNQGNQRTSSVSIRGVGKVGQTEAQDPSVGIIVDGVNFAYNPLTSSYDFTDVDVVEVTRGPQGTLQGKNASLGVISVTTKRPSFTPSADYSLTFGQNDSFSGRLAAGGPLVDDLVAWRASFNVDKSAGDIKNIYNEDSTYQNTDRLSGRLQLLLTPTDNFTARLAVEVQPRSGENTNGRTFYTPTPTTFANGAPNSLSSDAATRLARPWFAQQSGYSYEDDYLYGAGENSVYNDAQQPVVTGSNGAAVELTWDVNDYEVTSISAYKDYHFNAHNNDEGTPFDIQRSSGQQIDYKQISQELRVNSQLGGFVDYQAGLFLLQTNTDIRRNVIYGDDAGAWFATPSQYTTLDADASGRLLMQNSLNGVWKEENRQAIENKSAAVFTQANWHWSDDAALTTGVRFTREDRQNPGSSLIKDYGYGAELNPVSVVNPATGDAVQLGGFSSTATGALNTTDPAQIAVADKVAQKYFGVATYAQLSGAQLAQVAAAKAIRVTRFGVLWNEATPEPFKDTQPAFVISQNYKLTEDITTYASWQYGEKAGIAQQINGVSTPAKPEESSSYEWGVKTSLLNNTLVLNADVFQTQIRNYQQSVQVFDAYTTALRNDGTLYYTAATGNAAKVRVRGLEIDGVYGGFRNITLRFSGAYNDAKYEEFTNAGLPVEQGNLTVPYWDVSGQTLAGAPKLAFNVGVDYRAPLSSLFEFHTSANVAYTGRFNSDNALSQYGEIPAHSIVDFGVGVGTLDRKYDVTLLAKNLLDDDTPLARTWNSYTPATSRWLGVMLSGKL